MKKTLILALFILMGGGVALGTVVELNPTQDAAIWQGNPDDNYGSLTYFWTGYDGGWTDTIIQFDVSPYIGVTLNSATLEMYCYYIWNTPAHIHHINRVSNGWDEGTVTWNTRPGNNTDIWGTFYAPTLDTWTTCDVKLLVETWLNGSFTNYGFIFGADAMDVSIAYFYSKEHTDQNYHPKLVLDYYPVSIQSTSLGSIKTLFE